jgi:predicted Ser/Thr protein kinase
VERAGVLKKAAKAEQIETRLRENGYSEKAVKEILKWYSSPD